MFFATMLVSPEAMMEVLVEERAKYRLRSGWPGDWRVVYESDGRRHRRTVGGRTSAYEFRSVEQLRYDFERDAEESQAARR